MIKQKFTEFVLELSNENYYKLCETELSKRNMIDIILAQKKKIVVTNYQFLTKEKLKGTKEEIHELLFPIFYNLKTEDILDLLMDVDINETIELFLYFPEEQLNRIMEEELGREIDHAIIKMGDVIQTITTTIEKRKNENKIKNETKELEIEEEEEIEEEITELKHGYKMFTIYDWDSNEMSGVKNANDEIILNAEYCDVEVFSPHFIAAFRINPLEKEDEDGFLIEEKWEIYEISNTNVREIILEKPIQSIKSISEETGIITALDINENIIEFALVGKIRIDNYKSFDSVREKKILETFWTKEEIEIFEHLGITKFSKWDVIIDPSNTKLFGPPNTLLQNADQIRNKKFFFFEDYYLSFSKMGEKKVFIIGKDPDKNPTFNLEQE